MSIDHCVHCGNPILRDSGSPTGWMHGGTTRDWQGKRCPGRLTGAEPPAGRFPDRGWPGPLPAPGEQFEVSYERRGQDDH